MNLKPIVNVVTRKVGRQLLTVRKHSPVLLLGAGVVGVVATAVLASRATLKLDDILGQANEDLEKARMLESAQYSEEDRQQDILKIYIRTGFQVARVYAPAAITGILSITALTGSHVILTRRNMAVTAAYAALDKGFRAYRERVIADLGIDKDKEYRYGLTSREIVEEDEHGAHVVTVKDVVSAHGSIYARLFDETNPNFSKTHHQNQFWIQCQQNYANDKLRAQGHLFLNEVYDMLGMDRSSEGAVVGWIWDDCDGNIDHCEHSGDNYVDFGVFQGDRESGMRFVAGLEKSIWLDFNVDGIIYNKIG